MLPRGKPRKLQVLTEFIRGMSTSSDRGAARNDFDCSEWTNQGEGVHLREDRRSNSAKMERIREGLKLPFPAASVSSGVLVVGDED